MGADTAEEEVAATAAEVQMADPAAIALASTRHAP